MSSGSALAIAAFALSVSACSSALHCSQIQSAPKTIAPGLVVSRGFHVAIIFQVVVALTGEAHATTASSCADCSNVAAEPGAAASASAARSSMHRRISPHSFRACS